jgi:hypothetical protein
MLDIRAIAFVLLLLGVPSCAAQNDPCTQASSVSDVRFSLALKDDRAVFREGEIIPLVLSFTSTTKNRYWADVRNYDRSGRLDIEYYCVVPEAPDPLESYFKFGVFLGGGLGNTRALDATPFTAEAELNEWRRLGPGHYRVYAVSYRVWRPPDPSESTPYGHVSEIVRSNAVELEVQSAASAWQSEQLRSATQTLLAPSSPDDARLAARRLRFLNTQDSTRQLSKLFWGLNQQPGGWDLMFGLYGSTYRQLAIDSMRDEFAAPEHAITSEFLRTLVGLQVSADPSWDSPSFDQAHPEAAQAFWQKRQAHTQELMKAETRKVVAALPRKVGKASALTLSGLLGEGGDDPSLVQDIRPALIVAWDDLPPETQRELIQYRWSLIAGPEMLSILRRIVAEPPPPFRTDLAMARDAALVHINEIDPAAGRQLILRDLQNVEAQPSLEVVKLLPPEDIASAIQPVLERIGHHSNDRELDYTLLDHYADATALGPVQTVFEEHVGKWACAQQSAMLRYFLRVAPQYGAKEVEASLGPRKDTHCYSSLFQELGDELPKVQQSAIHALDDPDPELVQDAVLSLGHWGSGNAEAALWARLRRFHRDWAGRESQLRVTPDYQSPGSRGAALEQGLVLAIAGGNNWICPPDKLSRLAKLVWTFSQRQKIENWIKQWRQTPALINSSWYPEDNPTFSVLQYGSLTENQLRAKLAQFPAGTQLLWQFWQPGQIAPPVSLAKQEEFYERMRAKAEQHGVGLGKANHP